MGGFANNAPIVTDGLVFYVDAGNSKSYPGLNGSTSNILSLTPGYDCNVVGSVYSSSNGGTLVFDGTDDRITTYQQIQFEYNEPFSLSAWVNSSTVNNQQIINNENSSYRGYQMGIGTTAYPHFFLRNAVSSNYIGVISSTSALSANTWYNITSTYDGSSSASGVKIYVNAVEHQSVTVAGDNLSATTNSGVTTNIGRRLPQTQGYFNGSISCASIYSKELSASEVLQNYNALKNRFV